MAYAWQSVEEAALTLGVSTRTLHRRISKGEVETRLENGRREVLVCLPDPEPEAEATPEPAPVSETLMGSPPQDPAVAGGTGFGAGMGLGAGLPIVGGSPGFAEPPAYSDSRAIVLARQEIALANEKVRRTELALAAFQHTSQLLERETTRSRISARVAWGAMAVLSIGVYVAVGWTASRLTRANADREHISEQLNVAAAEVDRLRERTAKAEQEAARKAGELQATKALLAAQRQKPATQSSLLQKVAKALTDE